MADNLPSGTTTMTAYLLYEDVGSTIDWLIEVFGFTERLRSVAPDGSVWHAEFESGGALSSRTSAGPLLTTGSRHRRAGPRVQPERCLRCTRRAMRSPSVANRSAEAAAAQGFAIAMGR